MCSPWMGVACYMALDGPSYNSHMLFMNIFTLDGCYLFMALDGFCYVRLMMLFINVLTLERCCLLHGPLWALLR